MKKTLFSLLILVGIASAQFGHGGGGSIDLSTLLPIIADSSKWTAGSTVNAIKPRDAKTVEADSGKFGALHVTGNTTLDGNLTMQTTAAESLLLAAGGIRNEGGLRQKGEAIFGTTGATGYISRCLFVSSDELIVVL